MLRLVILIPLFFMLGACAGTGGDPLLTRSAEWLESTGDKLRDWAGGDEKRVHRAEVEQLFAQPYIDPLTDYLDAHRQDDSRAEVLREVLEERERRCQEIAQRFAKQPLTQETLARYRAGYSHSCLGDVEDFAKKLAAVPPSPPQPAAPAEPEPVTETPATTASAPVTSQLNECYLLTTIRNYREAKQVCVAPAAQGDIKAQYNMAVIARAMHDYEDARRWAEKAAPHSTPARFLLGELHADGLGVKRDDAAALQWFRQAAEAGHAESQYRTASLLALGQGAPRDVAAAQDWYRRAAEQNHAGAQYALGTQLLEQGAREQGRDWLLKAARQGLGEAMLQLGRIEARGMLGRIDRPRALVWYQLAEQNGLTEGSRLAQSLRSEVSDDELVRARLDVIRSLEGAD